MVWDLKMSKKVAVDNKIADIKKQMELNDRMIEARPIIVEELQDSDYLDLTPLTKFKFKKRKK